MWFKRDEAKKGKHLPSKKKKRTFQEKTVMQGRSFISGRAAVIGSPGVVDSGGYLVIRMDLEIRRNSATMGKKVNALHVYKCDLK